MLNSNPKNRATKHFLVYVGIVASLLILISSCVSEANPVRQQSALKVGKATFQVEMASNDAQRQTGLMFRTKLTDTEGMLFIFEKDQHLSFWMKNTLIPLSIAYISSKGEIKEILDMAVQSLAPVPSTYAVRYALEVPKGAFTKAGVMVGDMVDLAGVPQF